MESKLLTVQTTTASSKINASFHAQFSNSFLPILDSLSQLFLPFQSFEFIQIFFCVLQFLESSFWVADGKFWSHTKFTNILHYITFFTSVNRNSTENIILFCILFSIVIIISMLFLVLFLNYRKTRRINKPLLYTVRLYFTFIGGAILHPIASLTGHLFNISVEEHRTGDIIMLFLSLIIFIFSEGLFYVNQQFICQSIYFHKSLFSTFDSTILHFFFIVSPSFLILSHLFKYYPTWSLYILIAFHIFTIIATFFNYIWMSFTLEFGNSFSVAVLGTVLFNDIFRLFVEFFPTKISQKIFVILTFLVFFILLIVFIIVNKFLRKKVNLILSHSNLSDLNSSYEEKFQYFDNLNLNENKRKAMIYLIIGFTSGSDMFIDFSLVQYCLNNYHDTQELIILLMHLMPYFKSEKNLFETVLRQFQLLRCNSLYGEFIYFQAHRIKIFRQVTSTNYSSTQLEDLKLLSGELENQIKKFWSLEICDKSVLFQLEKQQRHLNNLWDESIEFNWSSNTFREEHIKFLIECCTDYQRAIQMTNIKEKIELLSKERNDLCLLSLFLCFPKYVNHRIVDKEGNLLIRKKLKNSSSSSLSNQNDRTSSISEIDFTNEEQIANSILTYGRLRLSMQNALNYANPIMHRIMVLYSALSILISLIILIYLFAARLKTFDSLNDWNQKVGVLIELRFAYVRSFFCLTVYYGQVTKKFNIKPINCSWTNDQNQLFIELQSDFDQLVIRYVNEARERFSDLLAAILDLALKKFNTNTIISLLFDPLISSNICYHDQIAKKVNWSMEQAMSFDIYSYELLANNNVSSINNWFINNSYWCHCVTNFDDIENQFTVIQNALTLDLSNSSTKTSQELLLQMKIIGPCHFLMLILPFPIILILYSREINYLIKIMLSTDKEFKEHAQKDISLTVAKENHIISSIPKSSFNWKFIFFAFFVFISFFLFVVFETLILYYAMQLCNKAREYEIWSCDYSLLRSFVVEAFIELVNTIYAVNTNTNFLTIETNKQKIYNLLRLFEWFFHDIMNDNPGSPSSLEKDDFIDQIVIKPTCEVSDLNFQTDFHDTYKCASLNLLFSTFRSLIQKCLEEIENYNGIFQGVYLENLFHIIYAHLITDLIVVGDRFITLQKEEINLYKINIFIFFICGIVFLLIYLLFMIFIISGYKRIFKMALCLIRRLPPAGLINNTELVGYLLFKKGEEVEIGVTHTIFNNSFDGIICLNSDGLVEIINKSFVSDYGYSPEQLVGQMVGSIFDDESKMKIENQLKLMKNHESNSYNEHLICFTNDGRSVPSYVTLFGIKGNDNNLILVIRDETVLLQKKKKLELAKKQSQDLLEQIMPQKVLMMLKQGKSDISFVVPSASVMFVDIVNFSGFSADLSPQQIMGTLSALFGAFDIWIQKYPLMTKIKLIGDTYMAACGLFAVDEDPRNHAIQCVDFALHVLNILDDINIKLNLSLQIRIGINSDGPIIAGVLGTENRVFDIIGDTINVASRLEHKAEPGHIMISEKTYGLVKDNHYNIIPQGEIYLKGKGNMPAYSI